MRRRAVAVVFRAGRVLLVRDSGRDRFSLPGGAVKWGERTTAAAARELYEELGLQAEQVTRLKGCDFQGPRSHHRPCLIEAAGEPRLASGELAEWRWWDMAEAVPVYQHVTHILACINKMGSSEERQ